jgi:hypothetical protein
MNDELVAQIERKLLGWPGVSKETGGGGPGRGGFRVPPATVYRFGRRQIGHVHHNEAGLADFSFPRRFGRSCSGPGGRSATPPSRTARRSQATECGALQTCPGPCNSSA